MIDKEDVKFAVLGLCLILLGMIPIGLIGYMLYDSYKEDSAREAQWAQYRKEKAKNIGQEEVVFNTKSLIYHSPNCEWAERCTVNCITVTRDEAEDEGGRPCKVCGGGLDEEETEDY